MDLSCPEMGLHFSKLKLGQMEKKLFQPHYDRAFKTKVIEEYLATGCTKIFLLRKYNIQFKSAIQTWMRVLGYSDSSGPVQKLRFGEIILTSLPKKANNAATNGTTLQNKINELQRQLEEEKLRSEAYARIIDKAEKELKIPIRKKFATR
jgi:transposase